MKIFALFLVLAGFTLCGCESEHAQGGSTAPAPGVQGLSDYHNTEGQTTPLSPAPETPRQP